MSIVTFAGRRFEYLGMHTKRQGRFYPGYVAMRTLDTGEVVRARADMVLLER